MGDQRIYFTNPKNLSKKQQGQLVDQYYEDPKSLLDMSIEDAERVIQGITMFYQQHLDASGMSGYVVGMSGGLDSTLVAFLAVGAVGNESVYGMCLPTAHTPTYDIDDTLSVIGQLGIQHNDHVAFQQQIEPVIAAMEQLGEKSSDESLQRMKRGNIQARLRMIALRDAARAKGYLVAGTSNASERMLGYATLAGDGIGGIDNEGIDQLFKTTVRKLGKFLDLPATVMGKDPSARLWEGQTDEQELGMKYENIDQVLVGYLLGLESKQIALAIDLPEVSPEQIDAILYRVETNSFKSELPPSATLYPAEE